MAAMRSEGFARLLVQAGVIPEKEVDEISRIVIDCQAGQPVQVYVQKFGQADALEKLAPMLKGMLDDG